MPMANIYHFLRVFTQVVAPGYNFRVYVLRTILLYEADFNLNNKHVGCNMIYKVEKRKVLANVQYGSHKKKTIYHALNKRLTFDILRQQKEGAGICSCDLKLCYNIIVRSFTLLAMSRAGVGWGVELAIVSMFKAIQLLKYNV